MPLTASPPPGRRLPYTCGVKPSTEFAYHLLGSSAERFADVRLQSELYRERHGGFAYTSSPVGARELEVVVRATHARYVLELGGGPGYTSLHIAAGFGLTGRLDVIEPNSGAAELARANAERTGFADRIRHYATSPAEVLPGLNGPYDLIVMATDPAGYAGFYDDVARLLRVGGTLLVFNLFELAWALDGEDAGGASPEGIAAFVERLAGDDRFVAHFPVSLERATAVRVR